MAIINGKRFSKEDLLKRVGNISQLARVRPFEFTDGKADGIKAFDIVNGGGLEFTVLEGKCLDLYEARYKGVNLNFVSKPGLVSPYLADLYGMGNSFLRNVSGGLLYTCGLSNVGAAANDEGMDHVFHGRVRHIPAEKISVISGWKKDEYLLGVSGEMREAALFNDNLVLRRAINTKLGSRSLSISDQVENEGYEDQALMIMYHINLGWPVLDAGTKLVLPKHDMAPRDHESQKGICEYDKLTAPVDHFKEQVFFHKLRSDAEGNTAAAAVNESLELGVYVRYNTNQLPNLIHWKSMMSGDYVLGIEPANCLCDGRLEEKKRGTLQRIKPFEKRSFEIEIGVLDGKKEIDAFVKYVETI